MFKVSIPLLLASVSETAVNIVANQLILSTPVPEAANLITTTQAFGLAFSNINIITSSLTSEYASKGESMEVGVLYRQSLLASVLFSVPSGLLFGFLGPILTALGQEATAIEACSTFSHYYIINLPGDSMLRSTQQTCSGLKKQVLIFGLNTASLPFFYFVGHALTDRLGVKGVALTYALRSYSLLPCYLVYMLCNKDMQTYQFFSLTILKNEFKKLKKIIALGLPYVADLFGEYAQFYLLNLLVGRLGNDATTIQNLSTQFLFFALIPGRILGTSSGILIGNALGDKKYNDVRKITYYHMITGTFLILNISGLALLFQEQLIHLFIPENGQDEDHLNRSVRLVLLVNSLSEVYDYLRTILVGSLRGLHTTLYSAISNNVSLWAIGLPAAYLFSTVLKFGLPGVWLGQCFALFASNIPLILRWFQKSTPEEAEIIAVKEDKPIPTNDKSFLTRCMNCFGFWKEKESNYEIVTETIAFQRK